MGSSYVEFPFDRIVSLHAPKKGGGEGSHPPPGPPYCSGGYGYGAQVEPAGGIISVKPYGGVTEPFTGSFSSKDPASNDGNLINYKSDAPVLASPWGLYAQDILLTRSTLQFSNNQIFYLINPDGHVSAAYWVVPMAYGGLPSEIVTGYNINMEWSCAPGSFSDVEFGLGIAHPPEDQGIQVPPPTEPTVILGGRSGGATYHYDMNEGVALLFWMTQTYFAGVPAGWRASNQFMLSTCGALGDFHSWRITPECGTAPE